MKILTLNTHSWLEDQQEDKIEVLVNKIVEEGYDLLAFQEVNQALDDPSVEDERYIEADMVSPKIPLKTSNFAHILVSHLKDRGHPYFYSWVPSHIGYGKYDEGLAILAKNKFKASSYLLSEADDYRQFTRRVGLKALLTIEGEDYHFFNVHLSWWEREGVPYFKKEWDKLSSHLVKEGKLIVVGDFNNSPDISNEGYDYIFDQRPDLLDSYYSADQVFGQATVQGAIDGWEGKEGAKRIDLVLTDRSTIPQTHRLVFDGQNGSVVSDHYGIEVII